MNKHEGQATEAYGDLRVLPKGWEWKALGDLALTRLGKTPSKSDYRDSGDVKIVKFRDLDERGFIDWDNEAKGFVEPSPKVVTSLKELFENDVLVTASAHMSDHIGKKVGIVTTIPTRFKSAYVVGEILQIRAKDLITPKWLLYYLRSSEGFGAIQRRVHGVHLITSRAQNIEIPFAPLDLQKRIIAEIEKQFSRLDEAVTELKRVKANLKRYTAAVLKAAVEGRLVETEALVARREGRNYETAEQLLRRILASRGNRRKGKGKYNDPIALDTTNLPGLPEGWTWTTLGQCFHVAVGATPSRKQPSYWNGGIPWVSSGEIQFGRIRETAESISQLGLANSSTQINPVGSVLLGMIGQGRTRGQTAILDIPAANNQNCAAIWVSETPVPPSYVFNWLMYRYEDTRREGSGNNQQALNKRLVEAIPMPVPPLAEQQRIIAEVDRHISLIRETEVQVDVNLQRADRLRKIILERAFSGELLKNEGCSLTVINNASTVRRPSRHFARALLSAEIVHKLHAEPTFGRIKHQKVFYLCEHIAHLEVIQGQYHREAAGPLDSRLIYTNEAELKKQKWYEAVPREQYGHAYMPLGRAGEHRKYFQRYWSDRIVIIDALIELMRNWTTDQCEIFATTYAAWNDLIINNAGVSEDTIVHEILHCWHDAKRRISENRWRNAISWMKTEGYAPTGFGKSTHRTNDKQR